MAQAASNIFRTRVRSLAIAALLAILVACGTSPPHFARPLPFFLAVVQKDGTLRQLGRPHVLPLEATSCSPGPLNSVWFGEVVEGDGGFPKSDVEGNVDGRMVVDGARVIFAAGGSVWELRGESAQKRRPRLGAAKDVVRAFPDGSVVALVEEQGFVLDRLHPDGRASDRVELPGEWPFAHVAAGSRGDYWYVDSNARGDLAHVNASGANATAVMPYLVNLAVDSNDDVWAATQRSITRLGSDSKIQEFAFKGINAGIKNVISDNRGNIWFSGLTTRIPANKAQTLWFTSGRLVPMVVEFRPRRDGSIGDVEFYGPMSHAVVALCRAPSGDLWFAEDALPFANDVKSGTIGKIDAAGHVSEISLGP
jgi:hypothetical protein